MKLAFKLFIAVAMASTTKAAAASSSETVVIRGETSIQPNALPVGTICTGPELTGDCTTISVSSIESPCTNLPTGFSKAITSVSINAGLFCTFYVTANCGGTAGFVVATDGGIADFSNTFYDQSLTCFICQSEDGSHSFI
ncbi:hypothetical protein B0H11DRAFT_2244331 [Mycena galericulata]|nr:hypothetical protein B0H11DRAFT_2262748 [Mycena galericulata]KAJ7455990.1 hypothetical protein B0H11DRAFT_2244331 [Mycena galericulata]